METLLSIATHHRVCSIPSYDHWFMQISIPDGYPGHYLYFKSLASVVASATENNLI